MSSEGPLSVGLVGEVVDARGESLGAVVAPVSIQAPRWRVVGADRPVATPTGKRDLAHTSGATAVDMESHAFVREASRRGIRLAIVRTITDGVDDALPEGIERLVDRDGRTRVGAAMALLARRPWMLPTLRALGDRTNRSMARAAPIVLALYACEELA